MSGKFSFSELVLFLIGPKAVTSGVFAYYLQPLIHGNDAAVNVIVTVFPVLACLLVAITVMVGDPSLVPPGSWRVAEVYRGRLDRRLARHQTLFMSYLVTLGLILISLLTSKTAPALSTWLERMYLFLGILAFLYSLTIPSVLITVQKERIDSVIESRRRQEGISR
jgi:MFS family permease